MKSFSRGKLFRILPFIFILLSFESHGQVAGITSINPFAKPINKVDEPSQQTNSTKKSAKKSKTKAKNSKKKSSKSAKKSKTKAKNSKKKSSKSAKKSTTANKNSTPPSAVYIDPLRDLGINKGYVCFRVKAYSNREISDFSRAVCTYIKNSNEIKLTWEASSSKYVIGYHIYFGNSAKKTNNFISDVM